MFSSHRPRSRPFAVSGALRDLPRQARMEAISLGHDYVGPEHVLLALARLGADAFARAGIDPTVLRERLHAALPRGSTPPPARDLPFTSRTRKVIDLAAREAQAAGRSVGAVDVLTAILTEEGNPGAAVLRELGVTADALRRAPAEAEVAHGLLHLKIDEQSDRSIFEQIVDGVQEAVATGRLCPGDRLPSVRRLADRLDVAPGTVARAYAELERGSVVVTDGARGTRVAERSATPGPSEALDGLLKPVVIAAFHMGATLQDLRAALDRVSRGILDAGRPAD
ncbi:MAG TPA: Clp protease N-terminal domain-containing protein [Longimicrobium sp.]|nr:Clp protease N-terminal domain-containing protein [Longimicrobium sp.]